MARVPELPDVEGFRTVLDRCARGRRIDRVEVLDPGVLHAVSARRLRADLEGRRFARPERHGKWLLARTDGPVVALHFGMTGRLLCCPRTAPLHPHDRVLFTLGREHLRYRDQRKLRGVWLAADAAAVDRLLTRQGPDALTLDRRGWDSLLSGRRARVKSVLLDQSALAGLGNLLADEVLWRAGVHPARRADQLTTDERRRCHIALRRALRVAVRHRCVPPREDWLTGHREDRGAACPRCAERLCRSRIGGRGTVWCPRCQPVPR